MVAKKQVAAKQSASNDPAKYTFRVTWSEEDQEHVGLCAEFPSLSWLDPDKNKAFNGIVRLIAEVLEDMSGSGETPPPPLSLQKYKGKIAVRVPPSLHQRLATEAAEQGVSLNRLISQKLAE